MTLIDVLLKISLKIFLQHGIYHLVESIYIGIVSHSSSKRIERVIGNEKRNLRLYLHRAHHLAANVERVGSHGVFDAPQEFLVLIFQQELGQLKRFLHSHAAMRNATIFFFKYASARCIMQLDREVVIEAEDNSTQGVAFSTTLHYAVFARSKHASTNPCRIYLLARGTIGDIIVARPEVAHVSGMMHHILDDDAARNKPFRVQVHPLERAGKQWCLGLG